LLAAWVSNHCLACCMGFKPLPTPCYGQLQYPSWLGRQPNVRWVLILNPIVALHLELRASRALCDSIWSCGNTYTLHRDILTCQFPSWVHNYHIIQAEVFSHKELVFYLVANQNLNSESSPSEAWLNDPPGIVYTSLMLFINHEFDRLLAQTFQIW
jgi:hypothetical protein